MNNTNNGNGNCAGCHLEIEEDEWVKWYNYTFHVICFFHHLYFSLDKPKNKQERRKKRNGRQKPSA